LAGVLKALVRESVQALVYNVVDFTAAKKVLKSQGFPVEEDETVEFKRTNKAKKVLTLVSEKGTTTLNLPQDPALQPASLRKRFDAKTGFLKESTVRHVVVNGHGQHVTEDIYSVAEAGYRMLAATLEGYCEYWTMVLLVTCVITNLDPGYEVLNKGFLLSPYHVIKLYNAVRRISSMGDVTGSMFDAVALLIIGKVQGCVNSPEDGHAMWSGDQAMSYFCSQVAKDLKLVRIKVMPNHLSQPHGGGQLELSRKRAWKEGAWQQFQHSSSNGQQ